MSAPTARLGLLTLLLVAEMFFLQVPLDGDMFVADGSLAAWLFRNAVSGAHFAITFVVAFLVLSRTHVAQIRAGFVEDARTQRWRRYLAAHLVAYALFAQISFTFFYAGEATLGRALVWLAGALLVGATWARTVASWRFWGRLFDEQRASAAVAGVTALIAVALGSASGSLWDRMAPYTIKASHGLLVWIFDDVSYDLTTRIMTAGGFWVEISAECSGYEGMGIVAGFLAAYMWMFRSELRWPNAYWLLLIGVAASWCGNIARIVSLITVGATFSEDLALGGFHSQAGWIIICSVAFGIVAVSQRTEFFSVSTAAASGAEPRSRYAEACLMPFLTGVASGMLAEAVGLEPRYAFAMRAVLLAMVLLWYRSAYAELAKDRSWPAVGFGLAAAGLWALLLAPGRTSAVQGVAVEIDAVWFPARLLWYIVLIPVAEELAFRQYLVNRLRGVFSGLADPRGTWAAVAVSGVGFGLLHGTYWLPGIVTGVLFGFAYVRRGSVVDAIVAHSVCNAAIAAAAALTGSWWLWG